MLPLAGDSGLVAAWVYPRDLSGEVMPNIAMGRLMPPNLRARLLSTTGDTITMQLDEGTPPAGDDLVYVERRGPFELVRRESWPEGRVLLTLAAWPRPS